MHMIKRVLLVLVLLIPLSGFPSSGCVRFALRLSPSLFPDLVSSIFEECDQKLAKSAIPGNLKLMEGLLKKDPENREILSTLCTGFCGYSMLFVEEGDPKRASELYLRAKGYGIRALGDRGAAIRDANAKEISSILEDVSGEDIEVLLWIAIAWNAWINLNLDKPAALAQIKISQACLERVLVVDSDYLYGMPCILMGASLSAMPRMFGGDLKRARDHFERALEISKRKFFLAQYYLARYYAVMAQDRVLFSSLLNEIIQGNPGALGDMCLINTVVQEKARALMEDESNLFL